MKNKTDKEIEEFLEDFFRLSKLGKNVTLQDLKKIEEESYEDRLDKHLKN